MDIFQLSFYIRNLYIFNTIFNKKKELRVALNVMISKYLFLIESLYMTINLCCHYIISLQLRLLYRAGITFFKP